MKTRLTREQSKERRKKNARHAAIRAGTRSRKPHGRQTPPYRGKHGKAANV